MNALPARCVRAEVGNPTGFRATMVLSAVAVFLVCQVCIAKDPSVEISTATKSLSYGDPLTIDVYLTFEEPQMSRFTDGVATVVKVDWLDLQVKKEDSQDVTLLPCRMSLKLTPRDLEGLRYGIAVVIWCDVRKEPSGWIQKMVFDKPGTYKLTYVKDGEEVSNSIKIKVKSSSLGEKGLSLMSPEDRVYLRGGVYKSPKTMSKLEEVVRKCKGTVLAQMAAARLGLDYFGEFERKRPDTQNFLTEYRQGKANEPLFMNACKYLAIGAQLPARFPIREKVLWVLAGNEVVKNNYEKAFSLLDDLGKNFPQGEHGERASSAKEDLEQFREQELAMAPIANATPSSKSYTLWIIGSGVVVIAAVLLVWKSRRRLCSTKSDSTERLDWSDE